MANNKAYDWFGGSVRSGWKIVRLGSVFRERNEPTTAEDLAPLSVTKNGVVDQQESVAISAVGAPKKVARKGDFVINSRSDRKGSAGIAPRDGSVSLINIVLEPKGIYPQFAKYLLTSVGFQEEFYRFGSGIVADLWTTRYSAMKTIQIPLPPINEQIRIADELDRELAEIDEFIADQIQLKELLNEQLEAKKEQIILEAGGQKVRLSRVLKGLKDGTHGTHPRVDSGGEVLLSAKNISSGELIISEDESRISLEEAAQITASGFPRKGDVMMILVGATYGRTALYNLEQTLPFQRSVGFFRPNEELITSDYLKLAMSSREFQQQLSLGIKTSAQPGIYLSDVSACTIKLPSLYEQIISCKIFESQEKHLCHISTDIDLSISLLRKKAERLNSAFIRVES